MFDHPVAQLVQTCDIMRKVARMGTMRNHRRPLVSKDADAWEYARTVAVVGLAYAVLFWIIDSGSKCRSRALTIEFSGGVHKRYLIDLLRPYPLTEVFRVVVRNEKQC